MLEGGTGFNKAHGMNLYQYTGIDQGFSEVFNAGMLSHSTFIMNKILQVYQGFAGINQLVDVGGGLGHNLKNILSKYPNIKGINFDLPHVVKHGFRIPGITLPSL